MEKIFEFKGTDFIKGQSAYPNLPIGGLFRSVSNFDPFEQAGLVIPSLTPVNQPLVTTPKFLTSFNSVGTDYLYAHSLTKLYQVLKDSPYSVTDKTSQAYQGISGTPNALYGRIKWKGGYVYAFGTDASEFRIHFNSLPVGSATDLAIKTSSVILDTAQDFLPFCQGADGNLYYGNQDRVQVITSSTGTSGNGTYYTIDGGYQIRDIVSDGRYLVIIADNNTIGTTSRRVGAYKVKIYFWDMVTTDGSGRIVPETMWDMNDSYAIAMGFLDGAIYTMTYNGVSVCNVVTQPKMIRSFPTDTTSDKLPRPLNPSQVSISRGSIYWVDGFNSLNTDIYAYGNPISGQQKIFYRPYTTGVTHLATCILWVGNNLILGTDEPALNFFNKGTTRGTATLQTLVEEKAIPYTYGFTKVALAQKLAIGQSVTVTVQSNATNDTLSVETKSYDVDNPKQTLLFKRVPTTNSPDKFSDVSVIVRLVGASLARITGYGTPLPDTNEEI